MRTTQSNVALATSLTNDPARWVEDLVKPGRYGYDAGTNARAEREVAATMSAIVGDSRPIIMRHNTEARWAVMIDESTASQVTVVWSTHTVNENSTGHWDRLRPILRGEAVMVMLHEMGHVLFTDEITRPDWCARCDWRDFFTVVNFAEDVRIEDCMEDEVPVFRMLRKIENDRMVAPNVAQWDVVSMVRRVCCYLFAERSCTGGSSLYHPVVNATEQAVIDECHDAFMEACDATDTQSMIDSLEPVYDALLPYMNGTIQYPPPNTTGGTGTDEDGDEDDGAAGPGTGEDEDEDGDEGTSGNASEDEGDGDGDTTTGEQDGDGDGEDEDGEDEEGEGEGPAGGNGAGGDEGNDMPDAARPDRQRGKCEQDKSNAPVPKSDRTSEVMQGEFISTRKGATHRFDDPGASARIAPTTRLIVKNLRRVLQDNANGGWIGRKRRGAFDASSSKRLALGDLRTFRERTGPKGSLDYSLVLCIDASGSMSGYAGQRAADAALSMYDAVRKIDGLDVALCAYGCTVDFGIPFPSMLTKPQIKRLGRVNERMLACVRSGSSGGTNESDALVWARAVSRKRKADTQMIVVITDGQPNDPNEVVQQVALALREGVVTGGIGIGGADPDYHTYATSIASSDQLPKVFGDFIRTMMKGGK